MYEAIIRTTDGPIATIKLNRPDKLNAMNRQLSSELHDAVTQMVADDDIGCIVLMGSEKAFAAGADVAAMVNLGYMDVYKGDFISRNWETIRRVRKPVIAAVAGFALGGGCEPAARSVQTVRLPGRGVRRLSVSQPG